MYYNQNRYAAVPYPHAAHPNATVKTSGCGVCCMSMVVEGLIGGRHGPKAMAAYAIAQGARASTGTDMAALGRAVSRDYGIKYRTTSSLDDMVSALRDGAWVIANVGGDRAGYTGLFSTGGHYVVVRGITAGKLRVHDPGYYDGKYDKPGRKGRVTVIGENIYVLPEWLDNDCRTRSPRYHIFEEADMTQDQFDKLMDNYLARRAKLPASAWAEHQDVIGKAQAYGVTDGSSPRALTTREEVMAMIVRALEKLE